MARAARKLDCEQGRVELSHGSGGRAQAQLLEALFLPAFDNPELAVLNDQARFRGDGAQVMTTDSFVVTPRFFPGGDIGCLAINGTINDIAVAGAQPRQLAVSFILEEGLPLSELKAIVISMAKAARNAGVPIITGDTKVVERGKGDGVFITTTGIGALAAGVDLGPHRVRLGDQILVNGPLGDHGVTIMSRRQDLGFQVNTCSDTAALHDLVAHMVAAAPGLRCLRDVTRGGLATVLNELAAGAGAGMRLEETAVPVREPVAGACEFLGLDPLYLANEGKLVAICAPEDAERLLTVMQGHPLGREAAWIGEVWDDPYHLVEMTTALGGRRLVDWLTGDPLPRIC